MAVGSRKVWRVTCRLGGLVRGLDEGRESRKGYRRVVGEEIMAISNPSNRRVESSLRPWSPWGAL